MAKIYNELLIITETGTNLFSSTPSGAKQEGVEMISGFLSALNTFAKSERGETMKELTLEQTTFIFEKRGGLIYIITTTEQKAKPLLKPYLNHVIKAFEERFKSEIANFTGNVAPFAAFEGQVAVERFDHAIDAIDAQDEGFDGNDVLQSIVAISRETGELAFTRAKQYVNKEDLGFLVPLLVKASERTVSQLVDQRLAWILVVSNKDKAMLVQPREHVFLVEEYKLPFELPELVMKAKKVKDKFPNASQLPEIRYLKIISNAGKVIDEIVRDKSFSTNVSVDATMLVNASGNLVSKYHKGSLRAVATGDNSKATLFVPFTDFFIMARGEQKDFKKFTNILKFIQRLVE
ncbi:MAG: hypothetical protein GYA24_03295 [Candidatus Lokiarchaeota archaeon]|nr:hypothetical protein [Candidatus Lokiarchaeota archaeon]